MAVSETIDALEKFGGEKKVAAGDKISSPPPTLLPLRKFHAVNERG